MATSFGPSMLYMQREGQLLSQQFDDETLYEKAKEEGWKSSPADFGVETAPSHPTTVLAVESSAAPAMSAALANEMQAAQSVLLTLQARVDALSVALGQLAERLDAFEARLAARPVPTPLESPASTEETEPPTRRRN